MPDLAAQRSSVAAFVETTKPGITRLVTITSLVGFALAAFTVDWSPGRLAVALIGCVIGTALSASGANALNQWMERARDADMPRTASRPLPAGELSPNTVLVGGSLLCVLGVGLLLAVNGPAPAAVSLACVLSYLLIYTPLKPITVSSTLVGAIPGALPPMIGWSAANGGSFASLTEAGSLSLFTLMFVWQLPHFLAIAWMYREDYAAGGYRVLPVVDRTGRATSVTILVTAALLLPATVWPAFAIDGLGWLTASVAIVTGLAYLVLCAQLVKQRSVPAARRVFFASIAHLPLLLIVMVADAAIALLG